MLLRLRCIKREWFRYKPILASTACLHMICLIQLLLCLMYGVLNKPQKKWLYRIWIELWSTQVLHTQTGMLYRAKTPWGQSDPRQTLMYAKWGHLIEREKIIKCYAQSVVPIKIWNVMKYVAKKKIGNCNYVEHWIGVFLAVDIYQSDLRCPVVFSPSKLPVRNGFVGWVRYERSSDDVAKKEEEDWACQLCTLINQPDAKACDACLTPKPEGEDWTFSVSLLSLHLMGWQNSFVIKR